MHSQKRNADTGEEISAVSPLVVDLDGTLVRSDTLVETIFALLRQNFLCVFLLPLWLMRGKARFKHEIASRVDIDAQLLPYHQEFLDFLATQHSAGRRLVLATASNERVAQSVADHVGIFQDVLASDARVNLSGHAKLERIKRLLGGQSFEYAGNSKADLPLWQDADAALLVNPERGIERAAGRINDRIRVIDNRAGSRFALYLKALRLHQWLKNLLIFVPLAMAHRIGQPELLLQALLAFLAFGLCASSVYLLNDLLDLPDDRQHPTKRLRPFAAGSISLVNGALLVPVMLVTGFGISLMLPLEFIGVLALYYTMTLAYSFRLKRSALVDVLTLAGLYTLRIIAGGAAVSLAPSFWLLAFSMFLFLSLALVKRFTELMTLSQQGHRSSSGRDYSDTDLETLSHFGSASAYMAVLVLALYINSDTVTTLYTHPEVIWLLCPLLLYLVMRIWLLARRDELHEDPVIFFIQDRRSQWLAIIGAALLWLAV